MPLHRLAQLLLVLAGLCTTSLVLGNDASEHPRAEAEQVRLLAENDLPRAQQEALWLQATLPTETTAADHARMLELTERYKSESQRREIEELTRRGEQAATQQRWLWTVLGGSLAMLVGTAFFIFRLQRTHHTLEAANQQLQQAQNGQQAILDAIPDVLVEVGLDGRYHSIYHLHRRVGMLASPVVGKTVNESLPPEAAKICMAALRQAHESGIATGVQYQLPSIHGERWFELSVARKSVSTGQAPRFVAISRDITERKEAEEQLKRSRNKQQAILEAIPDLLFEIGLDGCYYDCLHPQLRSELLLTPTQDLIGRNVADVMPPEAAQSCLSALHEANEAGISTGRQIKLPLPQGECWFELSIARKTVEPGQAPRFIVLSRDISERKRMEAAVEQERATLRSFFHALPEMAWMKDTQGRYIACNPIFERFFGAPEADIVGKTDFDFVDAELATFFRQKDMEALAADQPRVNEEWVTFAEDYQLALLETIKMAVHDAQGQVIGVLGIGRDITARKEAERMLHEREQAIRAMVENSPDLIARYDTQYRRTYVGPATQRLYGLPLEQILGTTPEELSALPQEFMDTLKQVMQDEQESHIELPFRRADGTMGWGDVRLVPEFDPAGKIVSVLSIGRDISERKLAEDALRESEQKYRTLIEKIQAAVIVHDADTRILTSNRVAREILGLSEEQLLGKAAIDPAWHFLREDGTPAQPDDYPVNRVLATRQPLKNHLMGVHHPDTGRDLWALVNADPVFADNGEITQIIVTFVDVTQRRRDVRKLVLLNRALNASSDAAFLLNEQGRFVYVNDAACRSLGYSREELQAMGPQDIDAGLSPETIDRMRKALFEKGSSLGQLESKHRARDGHTFPVEISTSTIELEGAKFGLSMVRDITERKRYEEHLRESEQRYREVFDNVSDTLYLLEVTPDGRFRNLEINPAFEKSSGIDRQQLIGKFIEETVPKETAEAVAAKYRRCIESGTAYEEEVALDLPNGRRFYHSTLIPVPNAAGRIHRIVGISRDVTLREQHAELDRRLAHFMALAPGTSFTFEQQTPEDGRGAFLYISPSMGDVFGVTPQELFADPMLRYANMLPGEAERVQKALLSSLRTKRSCVFEYRLKHPVRGERWLEQRITPEWTPEGHILWHGYLNDVTERKEAEARLQESYRLLQELTARSETAREEERKRIAREIHDELGQLLTALRLDISMLRIQFGDSNPVFTERIKSLVNLADTTIQVVRDVATSLRPSALNMGLKPALEWLAAEFSQHTGIECEALLTPGAIELDEAQATVAFRVAQESLTNIARHAKATHVEIEFGDTDDSYYLEIRDNGQGFDPDLPRPRSFGLAGMRERGLMLGGEVAIASHPGAGTTVRVTIPKWPTEKKP